MTHRRKGYTLIEMLAVISISGTLMAVTVCLLYALIQAESKTRDHVRQLETLQQLADQFRRDVHAATAAEPAEDGGRLTLDGGRTVTYRVTPGGLERGESAAGSPGSRDWFAIAPPGTVTMTVDRTLVSLVLPTMRVEAQLGLDRRLAKEAGK